MARGTGTEAGQGRGGVSLRVYVITGWQASSVPHWSVAYIEARSPEDAADILSGEIGLPDDDSFDRPETVWAVTPKTEWVVREAARPFLFILGGGCR